MEHNPFVALLLITGLAVLIPVALSRLHRIHIPIVVGEILAGVIIGVSGFNLVEPSETLSFLQEFGFAFLMFLSGLEVDFSLITDIPSDGSGEKLWARTLPMAVIILLLTLMLGVLGSFGLQQIGLVESPFLMGLILSTTSLGVVAPVLKEQRLMKRDYGQALLVAATLADFVTLLLLTVVIALRSQGLTIELLLIPVLLVIFVLVAQIGQIFRGRERLRNLLEELSHATAQIRVRGALALMVAWVVLAELLGVEVILGAFLAGAIANLVGGEQTHLAQEKLDAIGYGFFIPIFFIMVGVNLDIRAIFGSSRALLLVPLLLGVSYAVKILPALVLRAKYSWRDTIAGGVLLSARLSLIIAAAEIAKNIGAITPAIETDIILIAIVTTSLSPMVFNRIYQRKEGDERYGYIVVGSDQMTELLVRRLIEAGEKVTLVSRDETRLRELEGSGAQTISGYAADEDLMRRAGAGRASALVTLAQDNKLTVDTCRIGREKFGIPLIVAEVTDTEIIRLLQDLGVRVVQPALATAMALEGALRFPTAFDVLGHNAEDIEIGETALYNGYLAGKPLRRVRLPGNAVVLSIKRDHTVMVPHGDTRLQIGDIIALLGSPESVSEAIQELSG